MGKLAIVFPGQGAQFVGMGQSVYEAFDASKEVFTKGSKALDKDLEALCFKGPEEALKLTENTQPTILTTSIAIFRAIEAEGVQADGFAGLSLGEYSALVAGGALRYEDAVKVVRDRGRFMQEEVPAGKGAMAAILGMEREIIESVCAEINQKGVCSVANYNCPQQIVIAGEAALIEEAVAVLKEKGAKKAVMLPVSAPFHTKLLVGAGEKLGRVLADVEVNQPTKAVYTNVTAQVYTENTNIRETLVKQVSESVLWEDCVANMVKDGYDTFIEVGPGNALSKFIKKISKDVKVLCVETEEDVKTLKEKLGGE